MSDGSDIRSRLSRLAGLERRRRLRRLAWGGIAGVGLGVAVVVAWEGLAPVEARAWGYLLVALIAAAGIAVGARAWRRAGPDAAETALEVERAFPQARGAVRDALASPSGALGAVRLEDARAWLERRGVARLDAAIGETERSRIARWRSVAVGAMALGVAVVVAQPVPARRAIGTVADPASLWRAGSWRVEPGDARVDAGGRLAGRARFAGARRDDALVLEWRPIGGTWRAETLAAAPEGRWEWSDLEASRAYRLRYGSARSREYEVEVAPRFAVVEVRARDRDGTWEPLSGRVLPAGEPVEIAGRANGPVERVDVRVDGRSVASLAVRGDGFFGTVTLPAGTGRLRVDGPGETSVRVGPFAIAGAGRAWVVVLAPVDEVLALRGSAAWIEVRAGAPAGLASLRWEIDDGRAGSLADPAGALDTTLAAVVPLGAGRAPGDTVAWRIAAVPFEGGAAATRWRSAVLPLESAVRREASAERGEATRAVERALETAEEARRGRVAASEADRELRAAADSLARALERTLADPGLGSDVARDLRAQRDLLDRAASDLSPRAGLEPSPEASAEARAAMLEAVRERLESLERALERSAAADSLERLAGEQRELAATTRTTGAADLEAEIGPRQESIDEAAREALAEALAQDPGRSGDDQSRGRPEGDPRAGEGALERSEAEPEVSEGDPAVPEGDPEGDPERPEGERERSDGEDGRPEGDAAGRETPAGDRDAGAGEAEASVRRAEAALDAAARAVRSGSPDRAARAQEQAASGMQAAASTARERARRAAAGMAADRAALDRAGAEALFLADRQRSLADDAATGGGMPGDASARQEVVTGGLERTLQAMVDGLGGAPGSGGIADAIGRSVQATMYARRAVADEGVDPGARRTALDDAADALAALARSLLFPDGSSRAAGRSGQGTSEGSQGAAARELGSLADAQRALADAMGASQEPVGGDADAARAQRRIAEGLERVRRALEDAGRDPAAVEALERSVQESASRLERGLPGARSRTDLRALARRMSDLGRMLEDTREERNSETARPFVPAEPDPLPPRATARRLDAADALRSWRADLPVEALEPARRYLEALEEAGVRASPSPAEGSP